VSELVTHAMVRGSGSLDVTVSLHDDAVRLDVSDEGRRAIGSPDPVIAPPAEVGGWGLRVVDVLSDDWGASREADLTRVWMERRFRSRPRGNGRPPTPATGDGGNGERPVSST
jgi:hypothetical protein